MLTLYKVPHKTEVVVENSKISRTNKECKEVICAHCKKAGHGSHWLTVEREHPPKESTLLFTLSIGVVEDCRFFKRDNDILMSVVPLGSALGCCFHY